MARARSRQRVDHRARRRQLLAKELCDEDSDGEVPTNTKRPKARLAEDAVPPELEEEEPVRAWDGLAEDADALLLPVRTPTGKWRMSTRRPPTISPRLGGEDGGAEGGGEDEKDEAEERGPATDETRSLEQAQRDLATKAIALTEDTEGNIGLLREMLGYCVVRPRDKDGAATCAEPVIRLALLSVLAVFRDILPGYNIRPLTEAERVATVSKDVKRARSFEEAILSNYLRFLDICRSIIMPVTGGGRRRCHRARDLALLSTALRCIHELMAFASQFNGFEEVLKMAIHALTLPWESGVERTCSALRALFAGDEDGQVSAIAIRMLSILIKERNYDCPPSWLTALETVRIRSIGKQTRTSRADPLAAAPGARTKGGKRHMSGREKKEWKAKQEELRRLAEAETVTSQEQMHKHGREILKHLFRIYFGILKEAPQPALLPAVLAGLARHAHRIGVEYFVDLLQSLRQLMEVRSPTVQGGELDLVPALHCILTVDRIYAINENLAAMDLKLFYNCLYRQLLRMQRTPGGWPWEEVAGPLQACLANLFHPKRILSATRTAAFVQRLVDVAQAFLCAGREGDMPPALSGGPTAFMLDHVKSLLTHQVKARAVLDREPFGQGAYRAEGDDPDLSNPFARPMLPVLEELGAGTSPKIRALVDDILALQP